VIAQANEGREATHSFENYQIIIMTTAYTGFHAQWRIEKNAVSAAIRT
jgi:hypothetical protein